MYQALSPPLKGPGDEAMIGTYFNVLYCTFSQNAAVHHVAHTRSRLVHIRVTPRAFFVELCARITDDHIRGYTFEDHFRIASLYLRARK